MTPSRSYLVRALNEWILDNRLTPYVVVDASLPEVEVPRDFVSNGQIVLNISPNAVKNLSIGNNYLEFSARFGGIPQQVIVPILSILAIYAKENGQGMVFGSEPGGAPDPSDRQPLREVPKSDSGAKSQSKTNKPSLKVVK
jgi:stringent starvation protein B